ncbi:MAG TPA: restriction endonuclease [Chitinophagaceae bacterium]
MPDQTISSFLHKIFDWKEFEILVADLYKESDEIIAEHNVTEYGKSGSKYQIDVRVIQKIKLHEIKILIECKRWKSKVDRQIINVMAATIDDLNANKGVIFTTKGYEEGAIQYARSKNIDIFIIRDVAEDEWGKPGRFVWFYLQTFNGKITNIRPEGTRFYPTGDGRPQELELAIPFTKEAGLTDQFQLYSYPELKRGDNLMRLLRGIRNRVLQKWLNYFNYRMQPENGSLEIAVETPVVVKFENYPFKFLKVEHGFIKFETIHFNFLQSVVQTKFDFDRADSSDFVLVVENYITQQRNFISRSKEESKVILSEPIVNQNNDDDQIVKNGSILKIMMDYYVNFELLPGTKVQKTQTVTVNIQNPEAKHG